MRAILAALALGLGAFAVVAAYGPAAFVAAGLGAWLIAKSGWQI